MSTQTANSKRMNRTRVEWMRFLSPFEYVLLDKMLFQSNLTEANNGAGFKFHVRTLARDTGVSAGLVSQICQRWPFVRKSGRTKAMTIQLDYPAFESWIVRQMNNDCSQGEPRSKRENSTVPNGIVEGMNNEDSIVNGPSGARSEPQAIGVLKSAASPTGGNTPIVHHVNNKKSTRYVVSDKGPLPLPMPAKMPCGPSAARQSEIVRQLNEGGFSFVKDAAMGSERDKFKFCAVDDREKIILVTSDDKAYLNNPKIQDMCRHFKAVGYSIMLWTQADQSIFNVVSEKSSGHLNA